MRLGLCTLAEVPPDEELGASEGIVWLHAHALVLSMGSGKASMLGCSGRWEIVPCCMQWLLAPGSIPPIRHSTLPRLPCAQFKAQLSGPWAAAAGGGCKVEDEPASHQAHAYQRRLIEPVTAEELDAGKEVVK